MSFVLHSLSFRTCLQHFFFPDQSGLRHIHTQRCRNPPLCLGWVTQHRLPICLVPPAKFRGEAANRTNDTSSLLRGMRSTFQVRRHIPWSPMFHNRCTILGQREKTVGPLPCRPRTLFGHGCFLRKHELYFNQPDSLGKPFFHQGNNLLQDRCKGVSRLVNH